jgi:hypothetical protein
MSKQVPEVVLYIAAGMTVPALVLSSREGEVSHLGANGEPLLTLAIKKQPAPNAPHKRMTPVQIATTQPELEILHDVVHTSHTFSEDFKRAKGLRTKNDELSVRGHGEWREYEPVAEEAAADSADEAPASA